MSLRSKALNDEPPPNYESDSTETTIRCYIWGKCKNKPEPHYEGGEVSVFDHVEVTGISLFEMDRMLEGVGVYGHKKYYDLVEEYGFRLIEHDRDLHELCVQFFEYGREVVLYTESSFSDILKIQLGSDYEGEDDDDEDYNEEDDVEDDSDDEVDCNSDQGEFSGKDSDYDMEDDDDYEANVDQNSEWLGVNNHNDEQLRRDAKKRTVHQLRNNLGNDSDSDLDNSDIDAAPESGTDLESLYGSDEEQCIKSPKFNPSDSHNPNIELEMVFSSFKEFKAAVRTWNIKRGRPFKFVKSDKIRVRAKCPRDGCDWYIYAAKMQGEGCVQVRSFQNNHKCGFTYHNKSVKSGWVAARYSESFRENPRLDLMSFRKKVMKESMCFLSRHQSYRAKKTALKMIQGSEIDQYKKLPDYINEIRRSNPHSTVIMKLEDGYCDTVTRQQRFLRLYKCFAGVKQGFLAGCRPLFGLDGTFLKGPAGGVLLTAVGVDPNNGFFPIAYAAVEGETKDSWTWFLQLLKEDLQIQKDFEWTIMSDKQKGIIQACHCVFPNADHRFCVKHLHGNWSLAGYKGTALRHSLWATAKATTHAQFITKMQELAEIDLNAAKWLDEKQPSEWSRSHFRTFPKCDMLLNNICELFNSKILHAREESIVRMMESLRHYVMTRMQENRDRAKEKWSNMKFCPRILKRLQKNIEKATQCVPHKSHDIHYEVACPYGETFVVNLNDRTCTCRKWDLTGIPCQHAISAIWISLKDPMDFIDECYSVQTYIKCYEPCIFPVNGESEWLKTNTTPPLPPSYGKGPGRPKKLRRKNEEEIQQRKEKKKKMSRIGQLNKCTYCGTKGHNKRSCQRRKEAEPVEPQAQDGGTDAAEMRQQDGGILLEGSHHINADSGPAETIQRTAETLTQNAETLTQEKLPVKRKRTVKSSRNGAERKTPEVVEAAETLQQTQASDIREQNMPSEELSQIAETLRQEKTHVKRKRNVRSSRKKTPEVAEAAVEDNITCSAPELNLYEVFGPDAPLLPISQPEPSKIKHNHATAAKSTLKGKKRMK